MGPHEAETIVTTFGGGLSFSEMPFRSNSKAEATEVAMVPISEPMVLSP